MRENRKTLARVLRYIAGYKGFLAVSVICAAVSVILTLYSPVLIGQAVDMIAGPGRVQFDSLAGILAKMGILTVIAALAQLLMNVCNNRISYMVVRRIRQEAFAHLQTVPLSWLDAHPQGDTVSRIIADTDQFADGLLLGFSQLFTGVLTIIGTLFFMFRINPLTACVVVVLTPVSLLVAAFIARRTYHLFQEQSRVRGEQTAMIDEIIGHQKIVRAFGHEKAAQRGFDEVNDRLRRVSLQATFYSSLTNPCTRFVNSLVYAAVCVIGAMLGIGGAVTVGGLVSFLSYANQYTKPFNEISGVVTEFQNALACAARVFELIEIPSEKPDAPDAVELTHVDGSVGIDHVWFSYTPERKLIEDLNLHVRSGQRIAIVGPTGCGKSTIINLLMRFYEVDSGCISVSGTDIRQMTRSSLRGAYGMVLQETHLISGTIRENICLGHPDATEEEMIEAARKTHAHSFIRRLPDGYDTVIGEDGGALSQGQKQLLCITRVMLRLPPMLILDEATSSIDIRTEQQIQKSFAAMMQGRTSFIVAHRLSTIRESDVILVMRDGHIIEQGDHENLMRRNGFYAKLYNSQFSADDAPSNI